jgi:hypothetical protein
MTVTAELRVKFSAVQLGSNDQASPEFRPSIEKLLQFASGTGANQADGVFTDSRSVNASANDDIDLSGALTDALGASVAAAEMVGILIVNNSTTQTLTIGVAGTNPWVTMWAATGDGIKVFPGGVFLNFATDASGLGAVVAGASDVLRVANGSGSAASFDIAILFRTA